MKSVFKQCYSGKSILNSPGLLEVRYCKKTDDFCIGPKLNKKSSKEQVAEKIRQIYVYFYVYGVFQNKENIPLFPNYEKEILYFPFLSYIYSYYFMKSPWKKAEKIIAKDKHASVLYAIHVLKKRFELGEKSIKEDPELCLSYCIEVMKRKVLPKEMHQAMMLHAIKQTSPAIKRYFSYKSVQILKKEALV